MSQPPRESRFGGNASAYLLIFAVAVIVGLAGVIGLVLRPDDSKDDSPDAVAPAAAAPSVAPPASALPAAPAPAGLPVFSYWKAPRGFPADPDPQSVAAVTEGLRLGTSRVVYDKPGGTPRGVLPREISGLPVTVPIVARQTGWMAVLLPSTNRRVGWLADDGSAPVTLRDHLVLRRRTHELTWLRDGVRRASWTVATGAPQTATPLGRSFVLGRVNPRGEVYAGVDALALGSVPDNPDSLPASLRAGHTAIHAWYRASAFGRSISNGCIRMPKKGQQDLLKNIGVGTVVTVIE